MLNITLPVACYHLPNGFKFTASARAGRNMATRLRKRLRAIRIQKTPLEDVQALVAEAHDLMDMAILGSEEVSRLLEEVDRVIGVLGGVVGSEVTTPEDFVATDSPDSDPYEAPTSEPAAAPIEMALSAAAAIIAAKAIDPELDFPTAASTLEFLHSVQAHLRDEHEALVLMLADMDAQCRMLATIAVSRADDPPQEERGKRMGYAIAKAVETGRPYAEVRQEVEDAAGAILPVRAITNHYQLVPELEGQTRFMTPQAMKLAAQDWLKAQVAARKRATAKHKAALRSDLIKDFQRIAERANA